MTRDQLVKPGKRCRAAGSGMLAFALGVGVGIGFLVVLYFSVIAKEANSGTGRRPGSDISIDFSRSQGPRPGEPPILPGGPDGQTSVDDTVAGGTVAGSNTGTNLPAFLTQTHDTILDAPVETLGSKKPKQEDEAEPEPEVDDTRSPEAVKRIDHVSSAIKYEYYYAWGYNMGFIKMPGSFYAEVVVRSYRNDKWGLGAKGWYALKPSVHAVTTTGTTIKCYQMWPENGNDNSTLIRMLFVCPNGTKLKDVAIENEKWPVKKLLDSGR